MANVDLRNDVEHVDPIRVGRQKFLQHTFD